MRRGEQWEKMSRSKSSSDRCVKDCSLRARSTSTSELKQCSGVTEGLKKMLPSWFKNIISVWERRVMKWFVKFTACPADVLCVCEIMSVKKRSFWQKQVCVCVYPETNMVDSKVLPPPVLSSFLSGSFGFLNWIMIWRHFHTLTFYYINLKPPPTATSIKKKENTSFFFISLHLYKYTGPVCSCQRGRGSSEHVLMNLFFFCTKTGYLHKAMNTRGNNTLHDINYQNTILQQSQVISKLKCFQFKHSRTSEESDL